MTTAKLRTWDGTKLTITDVQIEAVPANIALRTVAVHTGRMIVRRVYMEKEDALQLADSLRSGGLFDQSLHKIDA